MKNGKIFSLISFIILFGSILGFYSKTNPIPKNYWIIIGLIGSIMNLIKDITISGNIKYKVLIIELFIVMAVILFYNVLSPIIDTNILNLGFLISIAVYILLYFKQIEIGNIVFNSNLFKIF